MILEIETDIDEQGEIHFKLPEGIRAKKAKIIIFGEEVPTSGIKLGLFAGKIKTMNDFNEPLPDDFWLSGKT